MGNTYIKKQEKISDARRSQLFAVFLKRKSEQTSGSRSEDSTAFPFMKPRPVTRRMAIFGQGYENSKVEIAKAVDVEFVYQVPKSKVTVNPYDSQADADYVTIERKIHGKDNERVFKNLIQEVFTPVPAKRKWKDSAEKSD